jgi:hypothetical protein
MVVIGMMPSFCSRDPAEPVAPISIKGGSFARQFVKRFDLDQIGSVSGGCTCGLRMAVPLPVLAVI